MDLLNFGKDKNYFLIIAICISLLLPLIMVGSYDRPSADDFGYSLLTHEAVQNGGNIFDLIESAVKTDINYYNTWQGLYSSAFILSLQPAIFGEQFYSITCLIILFIEFVCIYFSLKILNEYFIKERNIFVFTFSLVILTVLNLLLPSATQGLFWYNGAMNYIPWAFTNLLGCCLLIKLFYTDKNDKKFYLLLTFSGVLSFFTSGGNHVTAFANILFLSLFSIFLILKKKRYYSILPLALAIIGFIIMYTAPGTAIRQESLIQEGLTNSGLIDLLINTFRHLKSIFVNWMNFKWVLSLIIITPLSLKVSENIEDEVKAIHLFASLACSLLVIAGMFAVPYYAMSDFGAPRVTNVIWITFILLSWINYTLLITLLQKEEFININFKSDDFKKMLVIVVIISLILTFYLPNTYKFSNSYTCLQELKNGTAKNFAFEQDSRFHILKTSNSTEIELKNITPGSILYFDDLKSEPDIWPNNNVEKYYNKERVYVINNTQAKSS
ncbi:DUF6056 family protein [Methanobrevibacter sp.]|uniref:DUF6056 family protein n=1 Tax=Methanobrevibacter sp. TaxID=66852 RepID=UPI00388F56A9